MTPITSPSIKITEYLNFFFLTCWIPSTTSNINWGPSHQTQNTLDHEQCHSLVPCLDFSHLELWSQKIYSFLRIQTNYTSLHSWLIQSITSYNYTPPTVCVSMGKKRMHKLVIVIWFLLLFLITCYVCFQLQTNYLNLVFSSGQKCWPAQSLHFS